MGCLTSVGLLTWLSLPPTLSYSVFIKVRVKLVDVTCCLYLFVSFLCCLALLELVLVARQRAKD